MELNHAAVLIAVMAVIAIEAPRTLQKMEPIVHDGLARSGSPQLVAGGSGLHMLSLWGMRAFAGAVAPVLAAAAVTGVLVSVAQVGLRFSTKALQPSFRRLSLVSGLKRMVGPRSAIELAKSLAKFGVVGGVGATAIWSRVGDLGGIVGMPPAALARPGRRDDRLHRVSHRRCDGRPRRPRLRLAAPLAHEDAEDDEGRGEARGARGRPRPRGARAYPQEAVRDGETADARRRPRLPTSSSSTRRTTRSRCGTTARSRRRRSWRRASTTSRRRSARSPRRRASRSCTRRRSRAPSTATSSSANSSPRSSSRRSPRFSRSSSGPPADAGAWRRGTSGRPCAARSYAISTRLGCGRSTRRHACTARPRPDSRGDARPRPGRDRALTHGRGSQATPEAQRPRRGVRRRRRRRDDGRAAARRRCSTSSSP